MTYGKAGGTGLGLAIVQGVINAHKGSVGCEELSEGAPALLFCLWQGERRATQNEDNTCLIDCTRDRQRTVNTGRWSESGGRWSSAAREVWYCR